jgi:DNA-binding beta-propeller fold protein YncE
MKKLAFALSLACLLAPAAACAQNAYITNGGDNTVSVINTATNTVVASDPRRHQP